MKDSSYTAEAIEAAANHAKGHRWTPEGTIEVPFTQIFPYDFGGAGDINSNIEDMARWVRLQLGNGTFEGRRIVSPEGLAVTRTPKVALSATRRPTRWVGSSNRRRTATSFGTTAGRRAFGAFVGMVPDKNIGVIVLTNETNVGFPDALGRGFWTGCWATPKSTMSPMMLKAAESQFRGPRPSCSPSPRARGRSRRSPRWPARSPTRASARQSVALEGDALVMELQATGAKLEARALGRGCLHGPAHADRPVRGDGRQSRSMPNGFVQFQIDKNGKLNVLRLSFDDGQAYEFHRE